MGKYPKVKATMPIATPHRGPFASTTIPAGRPHAYIPKLPKVPCDYKCKLCFSRRCPVRTYNQVTFGLGQPQSLGKLGRPCRVCVLHRQVSPRHLMFVPCTYVCATRKCNKCSCNDRHETAILSDPVVIHDHCSQVQLHHRLPISRPHRVESEVTEGLI